MQSFDPLETRLESIREGKTLSSMLEHFSAKRICQSGSHAAQNAGFPTESHWLLAHIQHKSLL